MQGLALGLGALLLAALLTLCILLLVRSRKLERTLKQQLGDIDELKVQRAASPGLTQGKKDFFVLVGGERVDLKALSGSEFLESFEELPEFLYTWAVDQAETGGSVTGGQLDRITETAKRWVSRSAREEVTPDMLERLTYPEAQHALATIANENGITENLGAFFREQLMAGPARPRHDLRGAPEQPARTDTN